MCWHKLMPRVRFNPGDSQGRKSSEFSLPRGGAAKNDAVISSLERFDIVREKFYAKSMGAITGLSIRQRLGLWRLLHGATPLGVALPPRYTGRKLGIW